MSVAEIKQSEWSQAAMLIRRRMPLFRGVTYLALAALLAIRDPWTDRASRAHHWRPQRFASSMSNVPAR